MPSPVLFNGAGTPEPSPETARRLRGIHAGLFLRFLPHVESHWAVCLHWQSDHPGWARIQSGEVAPDLAHDIIGYLPMDCGVGEAPAYLEHMFRAFPRDEVRRMADAVHQHNQTVPVAQAAEQAIADVMDLADPSQTTPKRKRK